MQSQKILTKRMVWAWILWSSYALGTRTLLWFGHGYSGHRMLLEHERYHGLCMDAFIVCAWSTNVIMVWAWMLWSSYAHRTRALLWFGHGYSGHRMLSEHERHYGLGMDALVTICFWNMNVVMVWAWMLWSSYTLGTRTLSWFGHGCSGHRMLLEHERYHGVGMDTLVIVCSRNTNFVMVWAWILWSSYALGTRTLSWLVHGCFYCMRLEHERYHGLGMDALVIVCSSNTSVIMVWAWILWSSYALGTRTTLWFGHGCSGHHMLLEHERCYGLGMDALVIVYSRNTNVIMVWAWMLWSSYALGARTLSWCGHGCSGHRMLSEHERHYGLGMDALVTVCSCSTNVIMVWAWILWSSYALGTRTLSWLVHGCFYCMRLEHERYHGVGMDALVIVCSSNTSVIMVWAWMLWSSYALGTRTLLSARYGFAMDEVQIRILFKPEHEP